MQDTTVGAWAVMLHEECMGWVPTNISYVYAWYVHGKTLYITSTKVNIQYLKCIYTVYACMYH